MTVAEALPTMTDAEKVKAFDYWYSLTKKSNPGLSETMEVEEGSYWHPAVAIAHVIADRKPDLAPWTPEYGDDYYSIGWRGVVVSDEWRGEKLARDFGNVFRLQEEAEAHAARLRVFNRICQMMLALDWAPPCDSEVFRAMREYFTHGETAGVRDFDAIREQLEKEGAL